MGPREPSTASKRPNTCICKNIKILQDFADFESKAIQDSIGRPKKATKRHLNSFENLKKGSHEWDHFLFVDQSRNHFGITLGCKSP